MVLMIGKGRIMETHIGIWEVVLVDDECDETVLIATMLTDSASSYVSRFSQEHTAVFKNDSGYLTEEGFIKLANEAANYAYECNAY